MTRGGDGMTRGGEGMTGGGEGMTGGAGAPNDLIEDYLDRLLVSLSGSPRQVRHTLAEVEAHLRDAVAEGMADGLPEAEAQSWAVARMGPVSAVAGHGIFTRPSMAMVRRLILTAALVGGGGLAAIGGAAVVGKVLTALRGDAFMTAPWPAGTYTRADCAGWLAGDPGAHSCVTAMLADHAWDFLMNATAGGILGLLVLGAYLVLRRRWRDHATISALPAGTAQAIGAGLATLAAVVFFGQVADLEVIQHGVGAGTPLSLGIAAAGAAVCFALSLVRVFRSRSRAPGRLAHP